MYTIKKMQHLGIDNVMEMLQCIVEETFESSSLKNIQCELNYKNILQMFLMYDVHCLRKLENWKKNYGGSFQKIYEIIGEMEALLSLSTIALDREVVFPEFSDSRTPVFEATDMYHPLIEREKVVSNTIKVDKGINIITGSNMSGKSTFLRTMGINMVLAYAGAPVCAKEIIKKLNKDYKIKNGKCKSKNAKYILKMAGLIE